MADNIDIASFAPILAQAIMRAENDPTGKMGVRSINTEAPGKVLMTSILNNYNRWSGGKTPAPWIKERPARFVDFMQRRWAPIGAENDPRNLNQNWAPNVRSILQQMMGDMEYKKFQDLNLVRNNAVGLYA